MLTVNSAKKKSHAGQGRALGWLGWGGRNGCLIFRQISQGGLPEALAFEQIPYLKQEGHDNYEEQPQSREYKFGFLQEIQFL